MNQIVVDLLSQQYYHELSNSVKYQRLANIFTQNGLTGIEKFLMSQSKGEFDHAQSVISHMTNRKVLLLPADIDTAINGDVAGYAEPDGLLSIFQEILAIEQNTTALLIELNAQALAVGEILTSVWLYGDEGLLKEQIEEEHAIKTIVDRISNRMQSDAAVGGINYDIDLWIDQEFNK